MECHYDTLASDESSNSGRKIIMHPLYLPRSLPWIDLRVFYVRLSNIEADESTPEQLTLNHVPLTPDTIIEVNGRMSDGNGYVGDAKNHGRKWIMKLPVKLCGTCFWKGKQHVNPESSSPTIEVYVAGCFSGTPITLTKTLQPSFRKKHQMKLVLDSIPEHEASVQEKEVSSEDAWQGQLVLLYSLEQYFLRNASQLLLE